MKSSDEIKKGLADNIPVHYHPGDLEPRLTPLMMVDLEDLHGDALALIQQLQGDNAQKARCIENMTDKLNAMNDEVAQLQAERDAALADFKLYRERNIKGECGVYACDLCKRGGRYEDWDEIKCPTGCSGVSHWEWRGVQKGK